MDCQYISQNEIMEKYLSGKLSQEEEQQFLAHLENCPDCQVRLEREKFLIGGIRRIGREEMKREIRQQVQAKSSGSAEFNWGMWLKIAAVFLVLVIAPGLIYYHQFVAPQSAVTVQPESAGEVPAPDPSELRAIKDNNGAETAGREEDSGRKPEKILTKETELQSKAPPAPSKKAAEQKKMSPSVLAESAPKTEPPVAARESSGGSGSFPGAQSILLERERTITPSLDQIGKEAKLSESETERDIFQYFSEANPQEGRRGAYRALGSSTEKIPSQQKFSYHSEGNTILLHFSATAEADTISTRNRLPEQFPIKILSREEGITELSLQIQPEQLTGHPSQIRLRLTDDNFLEIHFAKGAHYLVNLNRDSTRALLRRR